MKNEEAMHATNNLKSLPKYIKQCACQNSSNNRLTELPDLQEQAKIIIKTSKQNMEKTGPNLKKRLCKNILQTADKIWMKAKTRTQIGLISGKVLDF